MKKLGQKQSMHTQDSRPRSKPIMHTFGENKENIGSQNFADDKGLEKLIPLINARMTGLETKMKDLIYESKEQCVMIYKVLKEIQELCEAIKGKSHQRIVTQEEAVAPNSAVMPISAEKLTELELTPVEELSEGTSQGSSIVKAYPDIHFARKKLFNQSGLHTICKVLEKDSFYTCGKAVCLHTYRLTKRWQDYVLSQPRESSWKNQVSQLDTYKGETSQFLLGPSQAFICFIIYLIAQSVINKVPQVYWVFTYCSVLTLNNCIYSYISNNLCNDSLVGLRIQ
eukprot:TRINITY_DN677_c0_g1_i2.p1 TRINITY_DN677_c0_g1~~TRINITY_DN677_c0_g1_i2.p1  ORF type:complete len:283 (-),score=-7.09 TRINITY_DN677_c0_g1_i2:20-868(-)